MPGQELLNLLGMSQPDNNPLAQPRFDVSAFDSGLEGTAKRGLNTLADFWWGATPKEQAISYAMAMVPFGLVARPAAKVAKKAYTAVKSQLPKLSAKARAAHPTLPVEGGWGNIGKRSAKEVEEGTNIIDTRTGEIIGEISPYTGKKTYLVSRTQKKPPARMEVHGRTQYVTEGDLPIEGLAASRKKKALDKLNSQRLTRQQYAIKANQKRLDKLQKKAEKTPGTAAYNKKQAAKREAAARRANEADRREEQWSRGGLPDLKPGEDAVEHMRKLIDKMKEFHG
jgi:uncharacterized coiled-coil protein SlyX